MKNITKYLREQLEIPTLQDKIDIWFMRNDGMALLWKKAVDHFQQTHQWDNVTLQEIMKDKNIKEFLKFLQDDVNTDISNINVDDTLKQIISNLPVQEHRNNITKSLTDYIIEAQQSMIVEASAEDIEMFKITPGVENPNGGLRGGKCGWFQTAQAFNNWLFSNDKQAINTLKTMFGEVGKILIKNVGKLSSKEQEQYNSYRSLIETIIKNCYEKCTKNVGSELDYQHVPFVIHTDGVNSFAIRTNMEYECNLKDVIDNTLNKYNNDNPEHQISKDTIKYINKKFDKTGTGFGTSAKKGLAFEPQLVEALITYILGLTDNTIEQNKDYSDDEAHVLGFSNSNILKCCQKIDELYDLKKYYNIRKNAELITYQYLADNITVTGGGNTHRQAEIKIIDPETFNIIENIDTVLDKSGAIIADITLTNDKDSPIYISCKIGDAQLSGITNNNVFYVNGNRDHSSELFNPNNEFINKINDINFNPLKGLCKLFNMNYDSVFKYYKEIGQKYEMDAIDTRRVNIKYDNTFDANGEQTNDKKPMDMLKKLLLCLIGSNYCYVNGSHPKDIIKVDISSQNINNIIRKIDIKFGDIGISNTGKTIKRKVFINGQKCAFVLRTSDSSHRYPYRLFIDKLDIYKFIKSIQD